MIRFLPFSAWVRMIGGRKDGDPGEIEMNQFIVDKIAVRSGVEPLTLDISNAVASVSRRVPWQSKCLVQASAAKLMMNRRKISSRIYLGVSKSGLEGGQDGKRRQIKSHAWLTVNRRVVLGGEILDDYVAVSKY